MTECTHQKTETKWVETEDYWTGEVEGNWETTTTSCDEDISLHKFKCSLCGRIGYYSGAARDYYEKGISSPYIRGLHD